MTQFIANMSSIVVLYNNFDMQQNNKSSQKFVDSMFKPYEQKKS